MKAAAQAHLNTSSPKTRGIEPTPTAKWTPESNWLDHSVLYIQI